MPWRDPFDWWRRTRTDEDAAQWLERLEADRAERGEPATRSFLRDWGVLLLLAAFVIAAVALRALGVT